MKAAVRRWVWPSRTLAVGLGAAGALLGAAGARAQAPGSAGSGETPTAGVHAGVEPPNAPLAVSLRAGRLRLFYGGRPILDGTIAGQGAVAELRTLTDSAGGKVTQVLKWTARGGGR